MNGRRKGALESAFRLQYTARSLRIHMVSTSALCRNARGEVHCVSYLTVWTAERFTFVASCSA